MSAWNEINVSRLEIADGDGDDCKLRYGSSFSLHRRRRYLLRRRRKRLSARLKTKRENVKCKNVSYAV